MSAHPMSEASYRRELGDGLVLRWSTAADTERICELYSNVFRSGPEEPLNTRIADWTRDMMSGRHPLVGPDDIALVEDTSRGGIVAATCLMTATWAYEGIPFSIGRPEVVASHEEYRNKGLVRGVFELIHDRCDARGYMVQGITGIPYYYRLFGYEFALDLEGAFAVPFAAVPKLKDGVAEAYSLRDGNSADLPFILELYRRDVADSPVVALLDEGYLRWVLEGQNPEGKANWHTQIILGAEGQRVGYVLTSPMRWSNSLAVRGLGIEGASLAAVLPSLLRLLQAHAASVTTYKADMEPASVIRMALGGAHPSYDLLRDLMAGRQHSPYGWYVRVPDLPAFVRHIAPALERRLAASALAGHTGELRLNFYRDGLKLVFKDGHLSTAESWRAPVWGEKANAGFPPLVFLQLLFGRRSLAELRHFAPDVWADDESIGDARALLEVLFPARASWVVPQD